MVCLNVEQTTRENMEVKRVKNVKHVKNKLAPEKTLCVETIHLNPNKIKMKHVRNALEKRRSSKTWEKMFIWSRTNIDVKHVTNDFKTKSSYTTCEKTTKKQQNNNKTTTAHQAKVVETKRKESLSSNKAKRN